MTEEVDTISINSGLTLIVFAPFGADAELSTYPDGYSQALMQHPLMTRLWAISERGVNVVALIDRYGDDTYLVEMPACGPHCLRIESVWKQDMGSFRSLRGLLQHASKRYPHSRMILSMEGHGAGFWPDVDVTHLAPNNDNSYQQKIKWQLDDDENATPKDAATGNGVDLSSVLPTKGGVLPTKGGVLPTKGGVLPTKGGVLPGAPISTFGMGRALYEAIAHGLPKLELIYFNNCFNFTIELLNTLVGTAKYAVGFPSYNFFTSGEALQHALDHNQVLSWSAKELAERFVHANQDVLRLRDGHPTIGGLVSLDEIPTITGLVNQLGDTLISLLPAKVDDIQQAIVSALQYDASGDFNLDGSDDDISDLHNFAGALANGPAFVDTPVQGIAAQLHTLTQPIKIYGEVAHPWVAPTKVWDYRGDIGLSIFLPDPQRQGLLDWRTPYYMDDGPSLLQPNLIRFLTTDAPQWVAFLRKYHEGVPAVNFKPVRRLVYPVFNLKAEVPPYKDNDNPQPTSN